MSQRIQHITFTFDKTMTYTNYKAHLYLCNTFLKTLFFRPSGLKHDISLQCVSTAFQILSSDISFALVLEQTVSLI